MRRIESGPEHMARLAEEAKKRESVAKAKATKARNEANKKQEGK